MTKKTKRIQPTPKEILENQKRSRQLRVQGKAIFEVIKNHTPNLMESKTMIQIFPMWISKCADEMKIADLNQSHLNDTPEAKPYKMLFEILKDETIDDAKQIVQALSGAIQEAETYNSFQQKIEDLDLKVFNEIVKK